MSTGPASGRLTEEHVFRAGTLADDPWSLRLTPEHAGWTYTGLAVVDLPAGGQVDFGTADAEACALPLSGHGVVVECEGKVVELEGRGGVFEGPSDFAYLPRDAEVRVRAAEASRIAFPSARCARRLPVRHVPRADVPVELRGAGNCSRQVHNFCAAGVFEADNLIAVEVLTPGGNWSSYPPHKHDEDVPGEESVLEEIYYFEVAGPPRDGGGTGDAAHGIGYQRVYGERDRPIDVLAEVGSGDAVCMPHGWHGPSMAAPGYDLYYLNVMAGPGPERAWLIRDDPAHAWVRDTWADQPVDPRLPFGRA